MQSVALVQQSKSIPSTSMEWILLVINGVLVLAFPFSLLNVSAVMIPAPEVNLITLIETVLGPVWVYLGGYEAPPASAVYGGTALIVALILHRYVFPVLQ